jgi:DNA-binding transcriptional regulator YiaG
MKAEWSSLFYSHLNIQEVKDGFIGQNKKWGEKRGYLTVCHRGHFESYTERGRSITRGSIIWNQIYGSKGGIVKKLQCTECKQVFWREVEKIDEGLIKRGEWIRSECPKCGEEWAIFGPQAGRKRRARRQRMMVRRRGQGPKGGGKMVATRVISEKIKGLRLPPRQIRSLRKRLGVSQRKLATLVGVSYNAVFLWEKGKSRPSGEKQDALMAMQRWSKEDVRRILAEKAETRVGKKSK